jgi:hypothetical protein
MRTPYSGYSGKCVKLKAFVRRHIKNGLKTWVSLKNCLASNTFYQIVTILFTMIGKVSFE